MAVSFWVLNCPCCQEQTEFPRRPSYPVVHCSRCGAHVGIGELAYVTQTAGYIPPLEGHGDWSEAKKPETTAG